MSGGCNIVSSPQHDAMYEPIKYTQRTFTLYFLFNLWKIIIAIDENDFYYLYVVLFVH